MKNKNQIFIDSFFSRMSKKHTDMMTSTMHPYSTEGQRVFVILGSSGEQEDDLVLLGGGDEVMLCFGKWHCHSMPVHVEGALADLENTIQNLIEKRSKLVETYKGKRLAYTSLVTLHDDNWYNEEITGGIHWPFKKPITRKDCFFTPAKAK